MEVEVATFVEGAIGVEEVEVVSAEIARTRICEPGVSLNPIKGIHVPHSLGHEIRDS